MSEPHSAEVGVPYWLFCEVGRDHGFGTMPFGGDLDRDRAISRYMQEMPRVIREGFLAHGTQVEARLVVLSYVNGEPIVSDLKIAA
jgi:hypothetical protein